LRITESTRRELFGTAHRFERRGLVIDATGVQAGEQYSDAPCA